MQGKFMHKIVVFYNDDTQQSFKVTGYRYIMEHVLEIDNPLPLDNSNEGQTPVKYLHVSMSNVKTVAFLK